MDKSDAAEILGTLSTSVILLDSKLGLVYLNESAEMLIQCSKSRAIGTHLLTLIETGKSPDCSEDDLVVACEKCLRQKMEVRMNNMELVFMPSRKSKVVNCSLIPVNLNLDPRILVEIHVKEESEHFDSAGNNRTLLNQAFVRGLAHEIRNPLGGIRGAAQLLSNELEDAGKREYTDVIIRESDRLSSLVAQMQATITRQDNAPVNVHFVLEHARILIQSELDDVNVLHTDYDPSLPDVWANDNQLVQVFINILRNAAEATEGILPGPRIKIRTRIDHQVMPGRSRMEQVVRVDIQDNGAGIENELIGQIFQPLITGKQSGTGLGLSISDELVSSMGGKILVQSEPGKTVFTVYLILAESEYDR